MWKSFFVIVYVVNYNLILCFLFFVFFENSRNLCEHRSVCQIGYPLRTMVSYVKLDTMVSMSKYDKMRVQFESQQNFVVMFYL